MSFRLPRWTLTFYVPHPHLAACKAALFSAGAGTYPGGKYTQACFEYPGTGHFMANEGANPNIGAVGQVETVEEMKVEMICVGREVVEKAVKALVEAHPYEQVAYQVFKMEDI